MNAFDYPQDTPGILEAQMRAYIGAEGLQPHSAPAHPRVEYSGPPQCDDSTPPACLSVDWVILRGAHCTVLKPITSLELDDAQHMGVVFSGPYTECLKHMNYGGTQNA